ncbi:MAG: hypothetical protein ACRYF5_15475 [Janthinobacterium lividum]
MNKVWQCGALMRVYMCINILLTNSIAVTEDRSLVHDLTEAAGTPGKVVLIAMTVFAIAGLIDALINDVLPSRFVMKTGLRFRQAILTGLMFGYAAQMWFGVAIDSYTVLLIYTEHIVFLFISSIVDVKVRYIHNRRAGDINVA